MDGGFGANSSDDSESPFALAMEVIRKREKYMKKSDFEFIWVPANNQAGRERYPPQLRDLSLDILAMNAEKIKSLDFVPDEFRARISQSVCDHGKVNARFVKLLASGCPSEIRVKDISTLTETEFIDIFRDCDTTNLTVLQLDYGQCVSDGALRHILASPPNRFAALLTMSLKGALSLSDMGLVFLARAWAAPALQSVDVSRCSHVTDHGINYLVTHLKSTLTELRIDCCQHIHCELILPALQQLEHLEVLSVTGNLTVSDEFVVGIVRAFGLNMRELGLAGCSLLTDISLKSVGELCPNLRALDLCRLFRLKDASLKYVANGCRSIHNLKFYQNDFSDHAVAAFLEASGRFLTNLSLTNMHKVTRITAISIAKSRDLVRLDLSRCRNLTDESLGVIVDNCLSLELLLLNGCSQITDAFRKGHSNKRLKIIDTAHPEA